VNRKALKIIIILFVILLFAACSNQHVNYHEAEAYHLPYKTDAATETIQDATSSEDSHDEVLDEDAQDEQLTESTNDETITEPTQDEVLYQDDTVCMAVLIEQMTDPIDFVPFFPQSVEISEYGRQVATDFLSQMTTIFTGMGEAETLWDDERTQTGRFFVGSEWERDEHGQYQRIATYEVPEIYFVPYDWMGIRGVFNREGDEITDAPWLNISGEVSFSSGEGWWSFSTKTVSYASGFFLFDFLGNGIPDILVRFDPIFTGNTEISSFSKLYRYADGEYRVIDELFGRIFWAVWDMVFVDDSGRLINFVNDGYNGYFAYHHLVISDEGIGFHPLIVLGCGFEFQSDWEAWEAHHWYEWTELPDGSHFLDGWHLHNPTIFGTDVSITPLNSLTDLASEIFTYLQHKRQSHE